MDSSGDQSNGTGSNTSDSLHYPKVVLVTGACRFLGGYLTARPIVTYDASFQLDFLIGTIPVEDFVFRISHLSLALIVYVSLKISSEEEEIVGDAEPGLTFGGLGLQAALRPAGGARDRPLDHIP